MRLQQEEFTIARNKYLARQEVKEIISIKLSIEEIMPEHKRYTQAQADCMRVEQQKEVRHGVGVTLIPMEHNLIKDKLRVLEKTLEERTAVLQADLSKSNKQKAMQQTVNNRIAEIKQYLAEQKEK